MIRYIIVILLSCFAILDSFGQGQMPISKNGEFLSIVINKANVRGYTDINFEGQPVNLNFKELYFVFKEFGNKIAIGKNNKIDYYIRTEDALLSTNCMKNINKVNVKATVVSHLTSKEKRSIKFSEKPKSNEYINDLTLYKIYYVYDIYPNSFSVSNLDNITDDNIYVLLGTSESFEAIEDDQSDPNHILLGWVNAKKLIFWKTRLAIEPNLSEKCKVKKEEQEIYARVWGDEVNARKDCRNISGLPSKNMIFSDKDYVKNNYQYLANDYRYPILERTRSNTFKIAFVGGTHEKPKNTTYRNSKNEFEVLFVLDASNTMSPYGNILPNSINEAADFLKERYGRYSITYGFSVFRNKKDIQCPEFNHYKYYGKTDTVEYFKQWVSSLSNNFGSCSKNVLQEDMYYAICKASDDFFSYDQDKIRIIYVISDVEGLERDQYNKEFLAKKLDNKHAHIIFINVNQSHMSNYKSQVQKISQLRNRNTLPIIKMSEQAGVFSAYSQDNLKSARYTNMFIQTTYYSTDNNISKVNKYSKIIRESFKYGVKAVDSLIEKIETGRNLNISGWRFPFSYNADFEGLGYSTDIGIHYYKGYVCNSNVKLCSIPELNSDCDKPFSIIVFLKEQDIQNLAKFLKGLSKEIMSQNSGQIQKEAFTRLLKDLADTKDVYLNTITEIEDFAGEIPELSSILKNYIKNGSILEPQKLRKLKKELKIKSDFLDEEWKKMIRHPKEESFIVGVDRYKWIPLKYFP